MIRIGMGYDVHQLVDGRPLIVEGVQIDHQKGLLGHSDADVLTHAIADAMLGALALGSIGDWFPDTDQQYKDANSIELLKKVHSKVKQHGHNVVNIDSVIIAQEPKFKPHIKAIQEQLALALNCRIDQIGVKATTTEWLGFEGREEGIAAQACVANHWMISQKDIERWYGSTHFRKKCDWICLDQPKVINEWSKKNTIGQIICSDKISPPEWAEKLPCLNVKHQWLVQTTGKPSHMGIMVIMERPTYKISI